MRRPLTPRWLALVALAFVLLWASVSAGIVQEDTGAAIDAQPVIDSVSIDGTKDGLAFPYSAISDAVTLPSLKIDLTGVGGHPTKRFIELTVTNQGATDQKGADSKDWGVFVKNRFGKDLTLASEFQTIQTVSELAPFNAWTFADQNYTVFNNATGLDETVTFSAVVDNWKTKNYLRDVWVTVKPTDLVFPSGKAVKVRVVVQGVRWDDQIDIVPKILGADLEKFAWANTSALWRVTLNLTSPANVNVQSPLLHLHLTNSTLNYTYCTDKANTSLYWINASGTEQALFGNASQGAYWEQFNFQAANASGVQIPQQSDLWLHPSDLPTGANAAALRIYCGTNGGTSQFSDTNTFADTTFAFLYERNVTSSNLGANSNTANANATANTGVNPQNATIGSQSFMACDAVGGCEAKQQSMATAFTMNASKDIYIVQVTTYESGTDLTSGTGGYFMYDVGGGYFSFFKMNASDFGVVSYDGTARYATTLVSNLRNASLYSFAAVLNQSDAGTGTRNLSFLVNGQVNSTQISGALTGLLTYPLHTSPSAIYYSYSGVHHSHIFVKGGSNWQTVAWAQAVHDTTITLSTQETADTTAPTVGAGSCDTTNNSILSAATFLAFNASISDAGGLANVTFNLNGTNTSAASAWNSSVTAASGEFTLYAFAVDSNGNYAQSAGWSCYYTAPAVVVPPATGGGGGGGVSNPVRSDIPILLENGRIVSNPSTDYLATFRLWLRQESLWGDWSVPNYVFVLLLAALGVSFGTRKNPATHKDELTTLGQGSVAFGLFAALAFLV